MKIYRRICTVLALIFGISTCTLLFLSPNMYTAINDPVTEEDYELLKENAINLAKTLDKNVINEEALTADFYFNENELVVTVESMKARITANIPISNYSLNVENGTIKSLGTIELENIKYEEESQLQPVWWYIAMSIGLSTLVAMITYNLFFKIWSLSQKRQ